MNLIYLAIMALFVSETAFAYIDPGTGSIIIQVLISAFLGALFTIKLYWKKLRSLFAGKKESPSESDDDK